MIRASKLDRTLFQEVEADEGSTMQAVLIMLFSSVCAGAGLALSGILSNEELYAILSIGMFASIAGWFMWSFIVYILGTTLFKSPKTSATYLKLMRTVGFSASPGILRLLIFIPGIGIFIDIGVQIWSLAASVIALQQSLDLSVAKATGLCISGWIIYAVFLIGIFQTLGIPLLPQMPGAPIQAVK